MPRRKLIRQSNFPYHVTTRTNGKDWFKIPLSEVWDYAKEAFVYANMKNPINLHCFILMNNHYHLLLTTPNNDIDKFMMHFNRKLSLLIKGHTKKINHKFSNRYNWTIVNNHIYLMNVYRYILQNPLRANIVSNMFDYPYSSVHFSRYEGKQFNYSPHFYYKDQKVWLETRFGSDFDEVIRRGLRKETFYVPKNTSRYNQLAISQTTK